MMYGWTEGQKCEPAISRCDKNDMDLDVRKPVLRVSNPVKFKIVCSATETS